jgi:phosphoribosylformimino-5-aminoimidazole carboxamide ribonucleotide (ProFAR) isomerase
MDGPDLETIAGLAKAVTGARLICSGGIGDLSDLEAVAGLNAEALDGVIVGKALYEGRFTVAEARAALGEDD